MVGAGGAYVDTEAPLVGNRRDDVLAVPARSVRAVLIPADDAYGFDTVAHVAARHGAHVIGRWSPDRSMWVGYVFHPAWALTRRVVHDVAQLEQERVQRGWRSPVQTVNVDPGVPVPALMPDASGRFTELVPGEDGLGRVVEVSATHADRVTGRPRVRDGVHAWKPIAGQRRAARDVRDVLAALVDPEPTDGQRPWMLVRAENGRALAVLVSRALTRNPSRFLIERGVPSIHAWRACYLPIDGDSELGVRGALDIAESTGCPLLGAYSGSSSTTGFRNLCLVMLVPPADRDTVADAIHDRMAVLAEAWGVPRPERHVARPHELSRLPCMASVKNSAEPGFGFVRVLDQPQTGPARVEPVSAQDAARILRIDETATIPATPALTDRVHLAPTRRPLGIEAAGWVTGMSASVRWHLTANLIELGARYKNSDGTDSASEAAWRCISSMRARGATVEDILEVLEAGGDGVRSYVAGFGKGSDAQRRGIKRDTDRYDRMRTTRGVGRHHELAERLWQAIPTDAPAHTVKVLAVLLDLVARVGRVEATTGEVRVDLGKRLLIEEAGAAWKTLTGAVVALPWVTLHDDDKGGRDADGTGDRQQSTWVINPTLAPAPTEPVRVPLRTYIDAVIRTRLVHASKIGPTHIELLLALTQGPLTRSEARGRFGLTPARLSQVVAVLSKAGLVSADRETLAAGPTSVLAAAASLGGVDRYDEIVDRHLAERADDDERAERARLPRAERQRRFAIKARAADDMRHAIAGIDQADAELTAPADAAQDAAMRAREPADEEPQPPALTAPAPASRPERAAAVIRPFSHPDAVQDHGDVAVDPLAVVEPEPWWMAVEALADAA